MSEKTVIFKETNDDWYPNFGENCFKKSVKVTLYTNLKSHEESYVWHRVCVWGADDCGMELDFIGFRFKESAEMIFRKISDMKFVNKKDLEEMGFVNA